MGGAFRVLRTGLVGAGGIGLAISAITAGLTLASIGFQAWESRVAKSKKAIDEAKKANEEYLDSLTGVNKAMLEGSIQASKEIVSLDSLYRATQNVNLSQNDRLTAVTELQKKYPDYFKNFTNEEILAGKAATAYEGLKNAIIATARARAAADVLQKEQEKKLINEGRIAELEAQKSIQDQNLKAAKDFQAIAAKTGTLGISTQASDRAVEAQREQEKTLKTINALKEENNKIDATSLRLQQEIDKQQKIGGPLAITGSGSTVTDALKKAEEERKKAAEAQDKINKKALKIDEDYNKLLEKLLQQRAELAAKSINEDRGAAIALSDARFQKIKDDAKREVDESKATGDRKLKLKAAYDQLVIDSDRAAAEARNDINKKFEDAQTKRNEAELKKKADAQKALNGLTDNQYNEDVQKVEQHYIDLAATIEKGGLLTEEAERRIAESRQRDIDAIDIKYGAEQIKKQTELNIAGIKVSEKYAEKSKAVERAKQIAILEEQLKGAEAQLALLTENGKTVNDVEVRNAQQAIDNIRKAITGAKAGKPMGLFEALGIDIEGQEEIDKYSKAASAAGKVTADFFEALIDSQQAQIDKKQELIDLENKEIDDLQSRVEKEMELRDAGYANNVETLQKELEAKKAQRDEDLKQQEEIIEKQKALRKAQLIADSVAQVSNLITAASQIFSTFSAIPIVGIPLAIAAIGLMFGAFAVAKVKAYKSINDTPTKFAGGGWIDGESHAKGGKKYRSIDGSGNVIELEKDEFVTNKKQSKKYGTLLEAINNDDLSGMHEDNLRIMFKKMGIGWGSEAPQKAVKTIQQRDHYTHQVAIINSERPDISKDVKTLRNDVAFMATRERNREERWEDDNNRYIKKGTKTTVIKKN